MLEYGCKTYKTTHWADITIPSNHFIIALARVTVQGVSLQMHRVPTHPLMCCSVLCNMLTCLCYKQQMAVTQLCATHC